MKPPCEIVVWYVIPAIRSELAKELLNLGMKQKDVSELMDITQPAVSQYITDKRGSGIKLDDDVRKMMPELLRNSMNFCVPIASMGGTKTFSVTAPFIYQNDGRIYGKNF